MITSLLSSSIAQAIAWTIVHSLWQIVIIALILVVVLRQMQQSSASARYLMSLSAMGLVVITSLVTLGIYLIEGQQETVIAVDGIRLLTPLGTSDKPTLQASIIELLHSYSVYIVGVWMIGTTLLLLRIVLGYSYLLQIVRHATIVDKLMLKKLTKLRKRFDISREVRIKCSEHIKTIMVMGIVRPIILFPVGIVNQLSADEVSAVLSHELAHIRRHDVLINAIQAIVEAFFYYHPAFWLITRYINSEREACCDIMAIQVTGNKVSYAQALVKLQELKQYAPQPALGMAGHRHQFSDRIKRILDVPTHHPRLREKLFGVLFLLISSAFLVGEQHHLPENRLSGLDVYIIDDCPQNLDEIKYYLDTIPERNNFHIKKRSNNRDLELHMEDGVVKELKIDGAIMPPSSYASLENVFQELTPSNKENIITVFPDCGDSFGNIYYLDKSGHAINLDNELKDIDEQLKDFEDYKENLFGFHVDRFDQAFIDSLQMGIQYLDLVSVRQSANVRVDSLLELLPYTLPQLRPDGPRIDNDKSFILENDETTTE